MAKTCVISIFHNRATTAEVSVKSLLNQSLKDLKVILVDDNSTDNTLNILINATRNYGNVTIIENKVNLGFTNSLIAAVKSVKDFDYIAIHGAGDISFVDRLLIQSNFLENNKNVGVVAVGVDNRPINNISKKIKEITTDDLLKRNCINHGTVMFRTRDYNKAGGYRKFFVQRQDKDLWYRMSLITKIYFLPNILYSWTKQEVSVSKQTGVNIMPTLLSEFATFCIKYKLNEGEDPLERYGPQGVLLFNPANSNHIFFRDFIYNFIRGRLELSIVHLKNIQKVNNNFIFNILLKISIWILFFVNFLKIYIYKFIKRLGLLGVLNLIF